jgi:hypothetical protein
MILSYFDTITRSNVANAKDQLLPALHIQNSDYEYFYLPFASSFFFILSFLFFSVLPLFCSFYSFFQKTFLNFFIQSPVRVLTWPMPMTNCSLYSIFKIQPISAFFLFSLFFLWVFCVFFIFCFFIFFVFFSCLFLYFYLSCNNANTSQGPTWPVPRSYFFLPIYSEFGNEYFFLLFSFQFDLFLFSLFFFCALSFWFSSFFLFY